MILQMFIVSYLMIGLLLVIGILAAEGLEYYKISLKKTKRSHILNRIGNGPDWMIITYLCVFCLLVWPVAVALVVSDILGRHS